MHIFYVFRPASCVFAGGGVPIEESAAEVGVGTRASDHCHVKVISSSTNGTCHSSRQGVSVEFQPQIYFRRETKSDKVFRQIEVLPVSATFSTC